MHELDLFPELINSIYTHFTWPYDYPYDEIIQSEKKEQIFFLPTNVFVMIIFLLRALLRTEKVVSSIQYC